jgi:hypothetical protein
MFIEKLAILSILAFIDLEWFSVQTANMFLRNSNRLTFVTELGCVFLQVGTIFLNMF